jgi:hypothetical protein
LVLYLAALRMIAATIAPGRTAAATMFQAGAA